MKLLVLTPEPIDASALRTAAGDDATDAEVLVVTPAAQTSPLRFWMSDADDAIAKAQSSADETAAVLEEDGVDAVAVAGEAELGVALQDALATFPADRIVVFTHPEGDRAYREDAGLKDAESRFGVPVVFAEITP